MSTHVIDWTAANTASAVSLSSTNVVGNAVTDLAVGGLGLISDDADQDVHESLLDEWSAVAVHQSVEYRSISLLRKRYTQVLGHEDLGAKVSISN